MPLRVQNRLTFLVERYLQRGALYQFLFIAVLIGGIALAGGVLVWQAGAFARFDEAIWWAFLRMTDPGYLGDDEGALLRTVSTVLTVSGFVLFVGALIATMTQWLNRTMRLLESGLTPIAIRNHILILGWTNRTPAVVHEIMLSEGRVHRFLQRLGARRLRIVILAGEVSADTLAVLRQELGPVWDRRNIIFRSGSPLRVDHLERVNYREAAVLLLPGADFEAGGAEQTDTRIIKTLLTIANEGEDSGRYPPVVAEVLDAEKIPIAQKAYRGELDLVASDAFLSRLIVQNVRHPGLSHVYSELLSHREGNEIYIRGCPQFAGQAFGAVCGAFIDAIPLGIVRQQAGGFEPILNPPPGFLLAAEDRIVVIARSYDEAAPSAEVGNSLTVEKHDPAEPESEGRVRRLLILGWSHKVPALIRELSGYAAERFVVDIFSVITVAERETLLAHVPFAPEHLQLRHLEGDYTISGELARHDPGAYDNIIVLGSDWLATDEDSDARTVLGYVLLMSILEEDGRAPDIIVEFVDPENEKLFRRRAGEVIVSPLILSHLLAHVALRRELNEVFADLFGSGGAEIAFRPTRRYGLGSEPADFSMVQRAVARHGEIALGIRLAASRSQPDGGVTLNPPAARQWRFTPEDEIVVLVTYS